MTSYFPRNYSGNPCSLNEMQLRCKEKKTQTNLTWIWEIQTSSFVFCIIWMTFSLLQELVHEAKYKHHNQMVLTLYVHSVLFPLSEAAWSGSSVISTLQFSIQPYLWQHNFQQIKLLQSEADCLGSEADCQSPCLPNLLQIMHSEKIRPEIGFHWMLSIFIAAFLRCSSIWLSCWKSAAVVRWCRNL